MAALAFTACGGGSGDPGNPQGAVEAFVEARMNDDYAAECDTYADELKQELGVTENCPDLLREARGADSAGGEIRIADVRERDGRAQAELDVPGEGGRTARISILMEEREGEWKVIAFP